MTFTPESDAQQEAATASAQAAGLFWLLELAGQLPPVVVPGPAAVFARASREESAELAIAMGLDDDEEVLRRFARGCHCHIVRVAGQLVSYGWITFDEEAIGSLGLKVHLLPGEAYIWDCATLATYRGQRLYPALLSSMLRELRTAGFQRVWIGMDADNLPSQAGVARAGFQHIVTLFMLQRDSARTFWLHGCPGASAQNVRAARYALLGNAELAEITVPV